MDTNEARTLYQTITAHKRKYPVRKEQTGERNLEFSQWLRTHCRPSKGRCKYGGVEVSCFVAYDLDFILHDYHNRYLMLLEVKTMNGKVSYSQRETLTVLDRVLRAGSGQLGDLRYFGLHYLRMSGTTPNNSSLITWNGLPITILQCWERLNFLDHMFSTPEAPLANAA